MWDREKIDSFIVNVATLVMGTVLTGVLAFAAAVAMGYY